MANIQPYVDDILDAVYGEEVRSSIANALTAMNDDITDDTASAWAAANRAETAVDQIEDVREDVAAIEESIIDRNLLKDSLGLTSTYWNFNNGTVTRNIQDPTGASNAVRLTANAGENCYVGSSTTANADFCNKVNTTYLFTVWLRADSERTINLGLEPDGWKNITVGTTWRRFSTKTTIGSTVPTWRRANVVIGSLLTSGWVEIYYPTVVVADLANVAYSGSYDDLEDTPALATVATSGSYTDLTDTPDGTYYKIINTNYANISYSGASVPAGNSVTLTGTLTLDSATTSVRALPAECNIGWFNSPWSSGRVNVEISGTTATITASVKNATSGAITSATARVFIIQLAR